MTKVLVAYDASEGAKAALAQVVKFFPDAELCLVQAVVPVPVGMGTPFDGGGPLPMPPSEELVDASEQQLKRVAREAGHGKPVETVVVVTGAADGVLQAAEEFKPDILAVGTHARRGLARLVLGSVAEQIVRRAPCPVLVVHAEHQKQ